MFLVLGHGTESWACSCVQQTPCGAHRYHDADFVGEALSRRVMPSDDKLGPYRVLLEVRVIESFRGTANAGDIVGVRTGFGGGDCGYTFKIGGKYLKYTDLVVSQQPGLRMSDVFWSCQQ